MAAVMGVDSEVEIAMRRARRRSARDARLEATIASAQTALRTAVLVNGIGAIALLAFFSQAFKDAGNPLPGAGQLAAATLWLVAGTAVAGCATGLSFLAQYGLVTRWHSWFGRHDRALTMTQINVALVFLSYLCFFIAGLHAYWALAGLRSGVFAGPPTTAHQLLQTGAALLGLVAAVLWLFAARAAMGTETAPGLAAPHLQDVPHAANEAALTVPDFMEQEPSRQSWLWQTRWNVWAALATALAALLQALALMA